MFGSHNEGSKGVEDDVGGMVCEEDPPWEEEEEGGGGGGEGSWSLMATSLCVPLFPTFMALRVPWATFQVSRAKEDTLARAHNLVMRHGKTSLLLLFPRALPKMDL